MGVSVSYLIECDENDCEHELEYESLSPSDLSGLFKKLDRSGWRLRNGKFVCAWHEEEVVE